jgi:protein tyrosine/serine phosphatase
MKKVKIILRFIIIIYAFNINLFAQNDRPENWAKSLKISKFKNLYILNDSLYRSEQPDEKGFKSLDSMGVKSILSLRSKAVDEKMVGKLPLKLYNVKMSAELFSDEEIIEALKVISKSPKPLLVHCVHGADRTGVVMAMYRIIYGGWGKKQAIEEMRKGDYNFHETYINIIKYIENVDIEKIKEQLK